MKTTSDSEAPPTAISAFQGRQEYAEYRDTPIEAYKGNPLIEALPDILSPAESRSALAYRPPYNSGEHLTKPELRLHLAQTPLTLFTPLPIHEDLEQRFSCMIRGGYLSRNPIALSHWTNHRNNLKNFVNGSRLPRTSATGFTIIGISGAGKSKGVERILQLYPQVIFHKEYHKRLFNCPQIVWLKLDCPNDGSIKALCQYFFAAIDGLLCTNYSKLYRVHHRTADALLPSVAAVAASHSLGVLVIDEIQHLNVSKSGGATRMLNLFVQLANTIGVPIVLIGTYKAKPILGQEFRQIRRGSGQGDLIWNPMQNDSEWEFFSKSLWTYQYLVTKTPWTKGLADVLYNECLGITDFAVKIFIKSQCEAIRTGTERLTSRIIRTVATQSFKMAHSALRALREGDFTSLSDYEDIIMPPDDHWSSESPTVDDMGSAAQSPPLHPSTVAQPSATDERLPLPITAIPSTKKLFTLSKLNQGHKLASKKNPASIQPDSLVNIVSLAAKQGASPHKALNLIGLIASSGEYIQNQTPA